MTTTSQRDWRFDYICCEHVATRSGHENKPSKLSGDYIKRDRACCNECWSRGYTQMYLADLDILRAASGLHVGAVAGLASTERAP